MDNEVSRMFHVWFQNVYSEGMESCCGIHMNLHNYSNTINQKTLPQKRKRTNEYLVDPSEQLESKRCHLFSVQLDKDLENAQEKELEETKYNHTTLVNDQSLVSSREPFPVIRMLTFSDNHKDNYTLSLANTQLASRFNPFKELYFSSSSQRDYGQHTRSNAISDSDCYSYESNPTYEIIPYTPERDIKNNPFCLQLNSEDCYFTSTRKNTCEDTMELG